MADRLQELFEELKASPLELWSRLLAFLTLTPVSSLDLELVAEILDYLLEESTLIPMWREAFNQVAESGIEDACHPVIHGPRILANILQEQMEDICPVKKYQHRICMSLVRVFPSIPTPSPFASLIEHLPHDMALAYTHELLSSKDIPIRKFLMTMRPSWCLKNLIIAIQFFEKYPGRDYQESSLQTWIQVVVAQEPMQVICKKLFFQKTFQESTAKLIVSQIPIENIPQFCFILTEVWGERLYISKGFMKSIKYLFTAIYSSIERIDTDQLTKLKFGGQNLPLTIVLSTCISNYFDSSDSRFRILGMTLAKLYALKMGKDIHFEELEGTGSRADNNESSQAVRNDVESSATQAHKEENTEDSIEFEPYYDPELEDDYASKKKNQFRRVYYLSVCLQSKLHYRLRSY